ncbi:MAG: putative aminohydrolase SsnA [Ardenticatenia bacterium]|nr:putative aminohydrolase SsnA [Ardenticatenia bacterium]
MVDVGGRLVLPGAICAHTHFYGAFARGMAVPGPAPASFPEILRRLWWALDKALTPEDVKLSALVYLVDAIRHGTTTLIDHHASPNAIEGSLDLIGEAVTEAGLRACLCYEVSDRDGPERAQAGIEENVRWIRRCQEQQHPHLAGTFGLHASMTLSDATIERAVAEARALGVGVHIHAAEGPADQEHCRSTYGERVIERLHRLGVLGPTTIVAHAITVDAWEMGLLRETGTWVSHQPRSNMNNAVGVADIPTMQRGGINVALGNDGFTPDMFEEMKAAYLLHKVHRGDPRAMGGDAVMALAYANNARLAQLFFPRPLGRLEPGAFADLVVLDYSPYTPLTAANVPWHIIFGVRGSHVTHTMVGGRFLMAERQVLTVDEAATAARARERAPEVWRRFEAYSRQA